MSAPLVVDLLRILHECYPCRSYRGFDMSVPLVEAIEDLTSVLLLLQIWRILHGCSSCCRYIGNYMSATLVAGIEDLT